MRALITAIIIFLFFAGCARTITGTQNRVNIWSGIGNRTTVIINDTIKLTYPKKDIQPADTTKKPGATNHPGNNKHTHTKNTI